MEKTLAALALVACVSTLYLVEVGAVSPKIDPKIEEAFQNHERAIVILAKATEALQKLEKERQEKAKKK